MSVFESIRQGLAEAIDFAEGKPTGARVHQVEVPKVNVAAIRASTGLCKPPSPTTSASPRVRCSIGNTVGGNRPDRRGFFW
ncbi:hypothetical protein [Pelagerythrobacter aerophilus]|uniref:hypothetical protein n=1 Tax=Pelagerythrobacter aerophilus TaxID=2306995 RepID=UPI001E63BC68|nr:hypothetical protein [Pelagerythrobacter aerophilus]